MRISILGNAGSGKSTLSRRIARTHDIPVVEIDKLLWRKGWIREEEDTFIQAHNAALKDESWIFDGLGLLPTIPARLERSTHIIFNDLPQWQIYYLLADRQEKWAQGLLEPTPGGQVMRPPTRDLFEMAWSVEQEWMPRIRKQLDEIETQKPVFRLTSLEQLYEFRFSSSVT